MNGIYYKETTRQTKLGNFKEGSVKNKDTQYMNGEGIMNGDLNKKDRIEDDPD